MAMNNIMECLHVLWEKRRQAASVLSPAFKGSMQGTAIMSCKKAPQKKFRV
jgi:hypothetical protein